MSAPQPRAAAPTLENRLPSEGINTSDEHPLREFAWLLVVGLTTLWLALVAIDQAAKWLAPRIPFRYEQALARTIKSPPQGQQDALRSAALQALADRLLPSLGLPADMTIQVRYDDSDVVNAYATLGGHITIFRGLLARMPSEDALAAVLAHEIAHVKHRHVATALSRALTISLALSVISADAGASVAQGALSHAGGLFITAYGREQETQSDEDALHAVGALYGHGAGYTQAFQALGEAEDAQAKPKAEAEDKPAWTDWRRWRSAPAMELMRSHPFTTSRVAHGFEWARQRGLAMEGKTTPLPPLLVVERSKPKPN